MTAKAAAAGRRAYATVLCGSSTIGIRTLGASLVATGTTHDLVALVSPKANPRAVKSLRDAGWRIVALKHDAAGAEACSKLHAWSLVDYERVVVLDPDMLVLRNIDELFDCGATCAVMEQSELINVALLVVTPDKAEYEALQARRRDAASLVVESSSGARRKPTTTDRSFASSDTGVVNWLLDGFAACEFWDPEADEAAKFASARAVGTDTMQVDHRCGLLPNRYNGDLLLIALNGGLGMVNTHNAMPEPWWEQRRARVVHFGLAGLAPWQWYAAPFLPLANLWEMAGGEALAAERASQVRRHFATWLLPPAACVLLLWAASRFERRRWARHGPPTRLSAGVLGGRCQRWSSVGPESLLCSVTHLAVGSTVLSLGFRAGTAAVPEDASPRLGWLILLSWIWSVAPVLWGAYLWLHFLWGTAAAAAASASGACGGAAAGLAAAASGSSVAELSRHQRKLLRGSPQRETVGCLAALVALSAAAPSWRGFSGAESLAALLGPPVLFLVTAFLLTAVCFLRQPVLWFQHGARMASRRRLDSS